MLARSSSTPISSGEMVGVGIGVGEGVTVGEGERLGVAGVTVSLAWRQAVQVKSSSRDSVLLIEGLSATRVSM